VNINVATRLSDRIRRGATCQKGLDVPNDLVRLVVKGEVIGRIQFNERCVWNDFRHLPAGTDRHAAVVFGMNEESWRLDHREDVTHVNL
jgi:hypothetical protein